MSVAPLRVERVRWREVTWPIAGGGAARGVTTRTARIVELALASGEAGEGEAAPLPGMSPDTLADVDAALAAFAARLPLDIALAGPDLGPVAAALAAVTAPAARFALETALLAAVATTRGTSLAALLAAHTGVTLAAVPVAIVVDTPAEAAAAEGARCLKIKVGPAGDAARVRAISAAAPGATLRIDANRGWAPTDVRGRLAALVGLPVAFVEEPCPDAHALLAPGALPLPLPIALDESLVALADADLTRALASPHLAALVLKPTLLGAFATLRLAARARAAGTAAIVTHTLEGPIGTAACAAIALALGGDTPAGLGPRAGEPLVTALHPPTAAVPHASEAGAPPPPAAAVPPPPAVTPPHPLDVVTSDRTEAAVPPTLTVPAVRNADIQPLVLTAHPTPEVVAAIQAALRAGVPLVLLHPRLPPAEAARQRALAEAAVLPPATAVVLFTSGSTGAARGVVLGRAALAAAAAASTAHLGWTADDAWLLALPMAHAGGLGVIVRCLAADRPVVLLEGDFEPARAAALLERCTLASLVPTQLAALLDDPAWRPSARLRAVLLGGAAAAPALLARAAARGVPVLTSYGLTETFGQIATAPLDRAGDAAAPLVLLPGAEVHAGTRAAPAAIRIRGPRLATCYLDGAPIAPELVTADLGFVEAGALHVRGRADDVIITGGENVHPLEVEAVLAATPGVRAACVFGVPDPRWGQVVAAALVVAPGFDEAAATAGWLAALAPHARPRALAVVTVLPLGPTGKVDRRAAAGLPRRALAYAR